MLLVISSNCFAMTFSSPIKVGSIFGTPSGGFVIYGATKNNGNLFRMKNGQIVSWKEYDTKTKKSQEVNVYGKGIAQFGNGNDVLYFYYDFNQYGIDYGKGFGGNYQEGAKNGAKFGGRDTGKLFSFPHQIYESSCQIEKISTDKGLTLYMLIYQGAVGGKDYILLGRQTNDIWVEYFNMEDINVKYFGLHKNDYGTTMGNRSSHYYKNYYCKGDTIIVEYEGFNSSLKRNVKIGEFRFKWDETAQWFGVEKVIY